MNARYQRSTSGASSGKRLLSPGAGILINVSMDLVSGSTNTAIGRSPMKSFRPPAGWANARLYPHSTHTTPTTPMAMNACMMVAAAFLRRSATGGRATAMSADIDHHPLDLAALELERWIVVDGDRRSAVG